MNQTNTNSINVKIDIPQNGIIVLKDLCIAYADNRIR